MHMYDDISLFKTYFFVSDFSLKIAFMDRDM